LPLALARKRTARLHEWPSASACGSGQARFGSFLASMSPLQSGRYVVRMWYAGNRSLSYSREERLRPRLFEVFPTPARHSTRAARCHEGKERCAISPASRDRPQLRQRTKWANVCHLSSVAMALRASRNEPLPPCTWSPEYQIVPPMTHDKAAGSDTAYRPGTTSVTGW